MKTFKRNLLLGYGISILLLTASSIASYISIRNLLASADLVNHTNLVLNELNTLTSALKDGEAGQRGYLLTRDRRYLSPYQEARALTLETGRRVEALTSDNAGQRTDADTLRSLAEKRFAILQQVIQKYNRTGRTEVTDLEAGRLTMDRIGAVTERMAAREQILLASRTDELKQFSTLTPILIVLASLLAIAVTGVSFARVNNDLEKRTQLQRELQEKDREISERLTLVQGVADQISSGNYQVKVDDRGKDALGGIAGSLNKMAASLADSFATLTDKEWLQTGIASLNENIIIDQDIKALAQKALTFITEYSGSQAGAFYVQNSEGALELKSSYALTASQLRPLLALGEGLAGQCAQRGRIMELSEIVPDAYALSIVSGQVKPSAVTAIPILYNNRVKGIVEVASLTAYTPNKKAFFEAVSQNVGIAINSAQSRERVQELLEETQAQTEELQAQHSELENINAELETQAEKLQASEEELRVQQEELQQANQELEERSRSLEEKNELILERNLEIQAKAEELAQSTSYKSEFLANMSHELRTPLNSILLLSRLLSENHESNLSPDQIEYANVIQSSGKGLLTLIDEILDLSKIEAGKMQLEYTDVKMQEVVSDLLSLFAPIAKDKGIAFTATLQEGVPGTLETDRLRLDQILRNLISNALKFTKKGSVAVKVAREGSSLSMAVKDTGIGIPENKQKTIFEAFQQADGSTRRQFGGTGLGLSISRELAKLLGGEIKVTSEVGKGSEFTLLVPLHRRQQTFRSEKMNIPDANPLPADEPVRPAAGDEYLSSVIPASIPDDRDAINSGDKVILMIEDDTNFAKSLLDYTRSKGYKGVVAVRGDEGLDLARRYLPIGILLDVQLPVKSGWEVMDELKADATTRHIPVHMMSSYQVKHRSLSKGALDFIDKPVAFEKLSSVFSKIEEALSRHPKKVMIVEEDAKHAQALAYFLENYNVVSEIRHTVQEGIVAINQDRVDCVILDMAVTGNQSYDFLEEVKKTPGFENIPIIIFTGKNLSTIEEVKLKQYADSIVVKTAHSYQRILDEVSLFLHLVDVNSTETKTTRFKRLGDMEEVLKGKTILVADDDVRNIFSLSKSLENYKMNVLSAVDGKDALSQLDKHKSVDLVLMDMMMPEMDGYESTRRIRANPKYRKLPVIAITAKAMTGDREKCIQAGASDYITKPVDVDQLISLLRVWLYH
ncbi:response regulator [Persicitalea jodogahamensis]|uniref:histidine kinase n=1 Tax=Persicitalea jodogahamensis TaxID=402147 RepID=A0A8J3D5T1_9BACT|nr:response regulator [Persicitalea jodogahamensis]GHB87089.1 histidine kinase [Persicitalea jodogahamensis]